MISFKNILWPTDLSPLSLAGGDAAMAMAKQFGAKLHVITVCPLLVFDATIAIMTAGDVLVSAEDVRGQWERSLHTLVRDYCRDQKDITTEALAGHPWYEICAYIQRASIDLVAISTHGRTGLKHVLIGSVAERVVQHASCPVLVIKNFQLAGIE